MIPVEAMPLASVLSFITDAVVGAIGDHGVYAVFLLMLVDAVLPAASELVMVYAGAVAAGAFAGQEVVLFGWEPGSGPARFLTMVLAGTVGYTIGSVLGWAIGVYGGRPFLDRRGRWLHLGPERVERAGAGSTATDRLRPSSAASPPSLARSSPSRRESSASRSRPTPR